MKEEYPIKPEWSEPTYLNLSWDRANSLPTPNEKVDVRWAISVVLHDPFGLQGINFDQVYFKMEKGDRLFGVEYRFLREMAFAFVTISCTQDKVETFQKEPSFSDGLIAFWPRGSGWAYYTVAYRIGCTHPNVVDHWTGMHTRERYCPDCGMRYRIDTSG